MERRCSNCSTRRPLCGSCSRAACRNEAQHPPSHLPSPPTKPSTHLGPRAAQQQHDQAALEAGEAGGRGAAGGGRGERALLEGLVPPVAGGVEQAPRQAAGQQPHQPRGALARMHRRLVPARAQGGRGEEGLGTGAWEGDGRRRWLGRNATGAARGRRARGEALRDQHRSPAALSEPADAMPLLGKRPIDCGTRTGRRSTRSGPALSQVTAHHSLGLLAVLQDAEVAAVHAAHDRAAVPLCTGKGRKRASGCCADGARGSGACGKTQAAGAGAAPRGRRQPGRQAYRSRP